MMSVLALAAAVVLIGPAAVQAGTVTVTIQDSTVSVQADDASLQAVLHAIAEKAGLTLRLHGAADRRVSVVLERVSMQAALRRLLHESHVLLDDRLIVYLADANAARRKAATDQRPGDPVTATTPRSVHPRAVSGTGDADGAGRALSDAVTRRPDPRRRFAQPPADTPVLDQRGAPGTPPAVTGPPPGRATGGTKRPAVTSQSVGAEEVSRLAAQIEAQLGEPLPADGPDAAAVDAIARSIQHALP